MKAVFLLSNSKGQSLMQTLVSVGIMAILMAAFASMLTSQQKESTALAEKLAKLELQNYLMTLSSDGSLCPFKSGVPAPMVNATTTNLALNQLYLGTSATAPEVIKVGANYSPQARNLVPTKLELVNIENPQPNYFRATLEVLFDSSRLVRAMDKVRIRVFFSTNAANSMNSCLGETVIGLPKYRLVRWSGSDGDTSTLAPPSCPTGYTLINWVPVSSYDNWTSVGICQRD